MQDTTSFRFQLHLCVRHIGYWLQLIRRQEISKADNHISTVIAMIESVLSFKETQDVAKIILDIFEQMLTAYQNRDYILAADYVEEGILPVLKEKAATLAQTLNIPNMKHGYRIEYTASATTTLAKEVCGKMLYLHSNGSPMEEADKIANYWEEKGIDHYIVAGLGLGYHVEALSRNPLIQVDVYEEDEETIQVAKECSDASLSLWNKENISVIHDPGYQKFVKVAEESELQDNVKICLYHPSVQTIRDDVLREKMGNLFLQIDNATRWAEILRINFNKNIEKVKHEIGELKSVFEGKTVYLIAGGPSLDKNISLLKKRDKDSIVLTVGTSLRRCLQEEINPDYVIITDPKDAVYNQISGIESCGVPMILLSTTYAWIAKNYKSEMYIACQEGYKEAERLSKQKGWKLVKTGGSVVTTAVDICIQLGVKNLIFLGLDLAFTGGKSHHGNAAANMTVSEEFQVLDINGEIVGTSKNLKLYREWIERRIAEAKQNGCQTEFIDATEGGARVEGTKVKTLKECIAND